MPLVVTVPLQCSGAERNLDSRRYYSLKLSAVQNLSLPFLIYSWRCEVYASRILWCLLFFSTGVAVAQITDAAQPQQPPTIANFSIMLVNPAGGAVVLMHNPQNALEYVDVSKTKEAFASGYVPARAAEIADLISALKEEISRLSAENARLQSAQAKQQVIVVPTTKAPSQAEIEARERAAKRQQIINAWLALQNMNRQQNQNINVNVRDCTRLPALCAGR